MSKNNDGMSVQEYAKGDYLPMSKDDLSAILEIGIHAVERKTLAKYPNTPEGFELFVVKSKEYLEYVRDINANGTDKKLIIDIESWCVFLGITRETLRKYSNRSEQWHEFIDLFKEIVLSGKKQLALTYKIPPMFATFDLVNNHGYHNTSEFHFIPEAPEPDDKLTREQLIDMARNLPNFDESQYE